MIDHKVKTNFDNVQSVSGGFKASCPAHLDDSPSLMISQEDNKLLLNCYAGCETEDILRSLNWEWDDLFLDEDKNGHKSNGSQSSVSEFKKPLSWINRDLDDKLEKYLTKGRKVSTYSIKYNNIGQTNKYFGQVDEERRAIVFPFVRDGKIRNVKYRDSDKNFTVESNGETLFFGHQKLEKEPDTIVVTEGELDVLAFDSFCQQDNIEAISVFNGANSNLDEPLDYAQKYFSECDEVILATDNDQPGKELQRELSQRLGKNKCKVVNYPDDCNDLNDVIIKYDYDKGREIINEAEPYPINGVYTASDLKEELNELYDEGYQRGRSTGWETLNEIYTPRLGEMTIITGTPEDGKSTFADCLMMNLTQLHDWNIGICSPENAPPKRHASMMATRWIEKPFAKGADNRMTKDDLNKAIKEIDERFYWIMPKQEEMSVENIIDMVKVCMYRYNIKAFLLDPWSALSHKRGQYQSEKIYIAESLSKFRRLARENEIHVFISAHPTKPDGDSNTYIPDLYDVSGASEWYDFADCGLTIWRDRDGDEFNPNRPFVYNTKTKFAESGQAGKVQLKYNSEAKIITDPNNYSDEDVDF